MVYEFEGRTDQEAIDAAVKQLGLEQTQFDVEILSREKQGLIFKRNVVRIRVHLNEQIKPAKEAIDLPEDKVQALTGFLNKIIELMGFEGDFSFKRMIENKVYLSLETPFANVLIGKQGRSLDALQVLGNAYWTKLTEGTDYRQLMVILDIEDYRERYEEKLVALALQSAERVRRTRSSLLLKPMNPFERRLVHSALNDMHDVKTQSEGTGNLKRIRIFYEFQT
jgi:spoIIIJ-associated protein